MKSSNLLPLAELSRQWAVHPSTAHRLEIRRALYLTTFDKNDVLIGEKQRSTFDKNDV